MPPKRPRDPNQLAKAVVDEATGQTEPVDPDEGKDPGFISASAIPYPRTRAMAAGVADHVWTLEEIAGLRN
jgi:hypothetical protein